MVQTYGFKPPNIGGWGSREAKLLIDRLLETLPRYGRICEKIFSGSEFLKINWVLLVNSFYKRNYSRI